MPPPALAALIGAVLRYSEEGTYDFASSFHIPTYLFLSLVVAMFLGLTNSVDDIIRDRPVLQRERNLNVRLGWYILAKVLTLSFLPSSSASSSSSLPTGSSRCGACSGSSSRPWS